MSQSVVASNTESSTPKRYIIGKTGGKLPVWQKGQSGNPTGANLRVYHEARAICAAHTPEAALRMVSLMRGDDERVAYMAATAIMERGAGKPRDHSDEENALGRIDLSALSQSDQALLIDLLKRVMGMAAPK